MDDQTMDYGKAIRAVVKGEFESAAESFNINPTGRAWERLQAAMWARQAIASTDTMSKAEKTLPTVGVGNWIKTLAEIHMEKGRDLEQQPPKSARVRQTVGG